MTTIIITYNYEYVGTYSYDLYNIYVGILKPFKLIQHTITNGNEKIGFLSVVNYFLLQFCDSSYSQSEMYFSIPEQPAQITSGFHGPFFDLYLKTSRSPVGAWKITSLEFKLWYR